MIKNSVAESRTIPRFVQKSWLGVLLENSKQSPSYRKNLAERIILYLEKVVNVLRVSLQVGI